MIARVSLRLILTGPLSYLFSCGYRSPKEGQKAGDWILSDTLRLERVSFSANAIHGYAVGAGFLVVPMPLADVPGFGRVGFTPTPEVRGLSAF